jgi:hypothetical protein
LLGDLMRRDDDADPGTSWPVAGGGQRAGGAG